MASAPARFRMSPGDITWDDGHVEKREMVSKASVHYRDATGSKRCGTCVMYHDNACDLVRGRIEPGDVCDRWEAKPAEKQYSRIVQLNGQETWVNLPPQEAPAAGGGAMMMPPVPGGAPGSTAGGEPPRWNGTEQSPRTGTIPEDADDAEWPTEGRTASPRPVAFPSTYMGGYWPQGQVQPQAGYQQPGGETDVPPSTVRKRPRNKVRLSEITKVGPEGYIHGYICVRPPCGHYEEAKFNSKAGAVEHGGQRVGRLRLNDDKSFSMTHIAADGTKTKLAGRFANRGDAAASAALYHNVTVMHREATGEAQKHLAAARDDLASGDHDGAIARLGEARAAAEKDGNGSLATHISGTQAALAEHARPDNQPVEQPHPLGEVKPGEETALARTALQNALLAWQKTPDLARVGSAHGDVISDALNHPEVSGTTLYRGMNWDRLSSNPDDPKNLSRRARFENLKPGSMLTLPASSFSEDKQTAKDFSSGGTGVRLEVAPGSRGVNVARVLQGTEAEQGNASEEAEWIAGGKYRVDNVSAGKDGRLVIQVSQVRDLSQPEASSEAVSEPVKPSPSEGETPSSAPTSAVTAPPAITPEMTAPAASPGSPGTSNSATSAVTKPEPVQAADSEVSPPSTGPSITAPRGPDISAATLNDIAKAGSDQYALHQAVQKHGLDASGLLRAQHLALNQKSRQALADENHMSLGKLDEALRANLQQLAQEGHVKARVTDDTLGKILDSGHFKTQFETAKNAIGPNKTRAELEGAWFGYPHELNPRLRPIYGYIEPGGDRPVGIGSRRYTGYNADQLSSFGTTQVVLKDSVKPRSTITVGDSIQNKNESMASPLLEPEAHSFAAHPTHHAGPTSSPALRGLDRDYGAASWRQNHFAEVQVHSADGKTRPVRTSDIDHVLFNDTPAKDLTDKLDAKGIPWRVFNAFTIAKDGTLEERQRALQVTREDLEYTRGRIARAQQRLQTASSWDKPKVQQDLTRMAGIQQSLESREKALTESTK